MIGSRSRTAVSTSMPAVPNARSPMMLMTSLVGIGELGAERHAEPGAELGRLAPAEVAARRDRLEERSASGRAGCPSRG